MVRIVAVPADRIKPKPRPPKGKSKLSYPNLEAAPIEKSDSVPRNTGWSWSDLVRECDGDEEAALALLERMPGLGCFAYDPGNSTTQWNVYDLDVHDEVPPSPATAICSPLDLQDGEGRDVSQPFSKVLALSDVGLRCGTPWNGTGRLPENMSVEEYGKHVRNSAHSRYGRA